MSSITSPLNLPMDPFDGFQQWLEQAKAANLPEPTAMTLATASADGQPHARIVLFKGLDPVQQGRQGFQFFTNYESAKSHELNENGKAALVFFWPQLNRQIRIEGLVEKTSYAVSDAYFQTRPRGSRIGAWSSPQSRKINSRDELVELVRKTEARFEDQEVPCPPFWGGWTVRPKRIEFWQAGEFRLHDRFVFEWVEGAWQIMRLAP